MEILYLLIPVSLILVGVAIAVFGWAVKSGQYDDLEGPAHRILFDDDEDLIPTPESEQRDKEARQNAARDRESS
jgi:cbb3-type cytochrome oxidase maturation protein